MTEDKTPIDQAVNQLLDLLVYAPLGLALSVRDELPKLADRGRQQVTGQITMARIMGEFAVKEGQKQGAKLFKQTTERFAGKPTSVPTTPAGAAGRAASAPSPSPAPPAPGPAPAPAAASTNGSAPATGESGGRPRADLAIPGYDTLSASQVVSRLAGLAPVELAAVAAYEQATRHRKTILSRIGQLQAEAIT